MAQITIASTDSPNTGRASINTNFTELYARTSYTILSASTDPSVSLTATTRYLVLGLNVSTGLTTSGRNIKLPSGTWRLSMLTTTTKGLAGSGTGTVVTTITKDNVDTALTATLTYTGTAYGYGQDIVNTVDFVGGSTSGNLFGIKQVSSTTGTNTHSDFALTLLAEKIA